MTNAKYDALRHTLPHAANALYETAEILLENNMSFIQIKHPSWCKSLSDSYLAQRVSYTSLRLVMNMHTCVFAYRGVGDPQTLTQSEKCIYYDTATCQPRMVSIRGGYINIDMFINALCENISENALPWDTFMETDAIIRDVINVFNYIGLIK